MPLNHHSRSMSRRLGWRRVVFRLLIHVFILSVLTACGHLKPALAPTAETNHMPIFLKIYRGPLNHLAAVRGGECPMHPSCSEYSRQAVLKHGAAMGWIMTVDRLMRCGRDEMDLAVRVYVDGKWKAFDPVGLNDFWWQENGSRESGAGSEKSKDGFDF